MLTEIILSKNVPKKKKKTLNNTAFKRGFIEGDNVSLQRQMVGSQIQQLEASL